MESPRGTASEAVPSTSRPLIDRVLFASCCVLGCLAQPVFLMMFLAMGGWASYVAIRTARSWFDAVCWLAGIFFVPTILLFLLWVDVLRRQVVGGGPHGNPFAVAGSALSLTVGGPELGTAAMGIGIVVAILVLTQVVIMIRSKDHRWVCWMLMVLVPGALIALLGRREVYPRYFLGTVILFDLALAQLAATVFGPLTEFTQTGTQPTKGVLLRRAIVLGLLIATFVGNSVHLVRLVTYGRGHGQSVVEYLKDHSGSGEIVVGSDHHFRHGSLLFYFGSRLGMYHRIRDVGRSDGPSGGPDWLLFHSQIEAWNPPPTHTDQQGNQYELRKLFPYAGLSGWHTGIYQKVAPKENKGG
ncbi:MAG: hypothetical protein FJ267_00475 [Planctomycetes bacterium]|nr:hypothetical protein [Planctomycetota bacterium]